jgi:hypothetical protein
MCEEIPVVALVFKPDAKVSALMIPDCCVRSWRLDRIVRLWLTEDFIFALWFTLAGASRLLCLLFCYECRWCPIPRLAHRALRTFIAKTACGSSFAGSHLGILRPSLWCRNKPYVRRYAIRMWWNAWGTSCPLTSYPLIYVISPLSNGTKICKICREK